MLALEECFEANRKWAARMRRRDPEFFERLREQQRPALLWIGCSDSRLAPDHIIGKQPGEIFVHRNVGNVVVHTDLNCLSVLQYGVEVLGVRHVIVCGHYGCGGVQASLRAERLGAIDNWLRHLRDVQLMHRAELEGIDRLDQRADRLCELNVEAQVANVCRTSIVQEAWQRGASLAVHGWIYSLSDGLLRDLDVTVERTDQIPDRYRLR
ncbi:MAG: carbonate dehydratase [Polyangiaceae bacterium]|nr:carbonate dehydratase [Polyangiaceae bacterium]